MSRATNPHVRVDFLTRARRGGGPLGGAWRFGAAVVAGAAVPLVAPGLYAFVELAGPLRAQGAVALWVRLALLAVAWLGLGTFDQVVRGPDRGVTDLHPVRTGPYVRAALARAAREGAPVLVALSATLAPCVRSPVLLVAGAGLLAGAWAAGLTLGIGVNLAAPALAVRPGVAPLLDAVRGTNPRTQAALIWAPAAALGIAGLAVVAAGAGVEAALAGQPAGWAALALPVAAAGLGARLSFVDGDTLARIPAVLGEVEATYAAVEAAEEGRVVYLEWAVRLVPAAWGPELLRVLRAGWRAERGWLGAGFFGAAAAGLSAWSDAAAPTRTLALAAVLLGGLGFLGPRLRAAEPAWFGAWAAPAARVPALTFALWAWAQPVVLAIVAATLVRGGLVAAAGMGAKLQLAVVGLAWGGAVLPRWGYVLGAVGVGVLVVAA